MDVSKSGKSYILRSVRNGPMNCSRTRCQTSDNFTSGSCRDKTLIYTDEMWFNTNNIEEGKCILEGTRTYINIKHQAERLQKRKPPSTCNVKPWQVVLQDTDAIKNRLFIYETHREMPNLKNWGKVELNLLMWLMVWQKFINKFIENKYDIYIKGNRPKLLPSWCQTPPHHTRKGP